jgi:hypothetical protein
MFGEQDPETKEVTYYLSDLCRKEEHKCGKDGNAFVCTVASVRAAWAPPLVKNGSADIFKV